jgi:hypothetical protein
MANHFRETLKEIEGHKYHLWRDDSSVKTPNDANNHLLPG